jgi:hypothetical protein
MQTAINESETLEQLRNNENGVEVLFTKKDGSQRTMLCTLSESKIPADKQPKSETQSSTVGSAVRVFDLEKNEWRSFRWDSVKSVNGVTYA